MARFLLLIFLICLILTKSFAVVINTSHLIDTTTIISSKDTNLSSKTNRQIIVEKLGRKLNILERIELFVLGKRAFVTSFSQEEQARLANNSISLSFWLALFSMIAPPAIIFSLLIKNSKSVNRKYLNEKSKRRLKFINVMQTFWAVVLGIIVVATILFMIYLVGYILVALFKGLH